MCFLVPISDEGETAMKERSWFAIMMHLLGCIIASLLVLGLGAYFGPDERVGWLLMIAGIAYVVFLVAEDWLKAIKGQKAQKTEEERDEITR